MFILKFVQNSIRSKIDLVKETLLPKSKIKPKENRNNAPRPMMNDSDFKYLTVGSENKKSRMIPELPQNLSKDNIVSSKHTTKVFTEKQYLEF